MAGVSPQTPESHRDFRAKYQLPFILLSDVDKFVIAHVRRQGPLGLGVRRATYLIDQAGIFETRCSPTSASPPRSLHTARYRDGHASKSLKVAARATPRGHTRRRPQYLSRKTVVSPNVGILTTKTLSYSSSFGAGTSRSLRLLRS